MTDLVVRRLLIDLQTPLPRHWCGGGTFRTAFFNALSMSFPVGEQFFIDSVRNGHKALSAEEQARRQREVQGFIGQEATHRRIHALFNAHLEKQGLVNAWAPRAESRVKLLEGLDPRHPLAITAANEHFTAILAEWLLRHPALFGDAQPRLKTLWLWHSAEESEHKSTAFELYQALGGTQEWRVKWMRRVTFFFLTDTLRQTLNNLRRDGTLWRWATWKDAASFLFGPTGLVRQTFKPWRAYFKPDFHPDQQQSDLSQRWLQANSAQYTVAGARPN
ncbi:metal-dependent hydrolase [Rhodoferax sediminis]|jgi:predicted metal-dependent hydrolase|uniref:Metal-dependent hydrolase n=1 Tax=Rhodoferax sediminis TaxID=2509614 RepID=A0A515DAT5_9BURK|nr:metal-dependent hydrolase [Rhodoferax sediminis]QDL37501.1 metal-dependent hydrolase [Rhodoferax sediminis]